jgi:hypothetical protein
MHTNEILSLISWPVFIAVSYFLAAWLIKKYEKREETKKQA